MIGDEEGDDDREDEDGDEDDWVKFVPSVFVDDTDLFIFDGWYAVFAVPVVLVLVLVVKRLFKLFMILNGLLINELFWFSNGLELISKIEDDDEDDNEDGSEELYSIFLSCFVWIFQNKWPVFV